MNDIENISIDKLVHHPNNPREDVGDITELTESIKANGIMQNLTVVPHEGIYWAVSYTHQMCIRDRHSNLTILPVNQR